MILSMSTPKDDDHNNDDDDDDDDDEYMSCALYHRFLGGTHQVVPPRRVHKYKPNTALIWPCIPQKPP